MFSKFFVYMDEQDIQDFFWTISLCPVSCSPEHPHTVPDHRQSQLPLQLPPILLILCIL